MKSNKKKQYSAPAVSTAVDIVTFLSKYKHKNSTLTEISKGVDINSSTCYRILQTLVEKKILSHNSETKEFSLGTYLMILGRRATEFIDYMEVANKYLLKIGELTEATCGIVQKIENRWTYVEKYIPESPYTLSIKTGQSFSLNAGATGKMFMAYLSSKERDDVIDTIGLKKYTEKTNYNKDDYLDEIEVIRKQGFSISDEEHYENIFGLAFPVLNSFNEIEFGITVIMFKNEKTKKVLDEMVYQIKQMTEELSLLIQNR